MSHVFSRSSWAKAPTILLVLSLIGLISCNRFYNSLNQSMSKKEKREVIHLTGKLGGQNCTEFLKREIHKGELIQLINSEPLLGTKSLFSTGTTREFDGTTNLPKRYCQSFEFKSSDLMNFQFNMMSDSLGRCLTGLSGTLEELRVLNSYLNIHSNSTLCSKIRKMGDSLFVSLEYRLSLREINSPYVFDIESVSPLDKYSYEGCYTVIESTNFIKDESIMDGKYRCGFIIDIQNEVVVSSVKLYD